MQYILESGIIHSTLSLWDSPILLYVVEFVYSHCSAVFHCMNRQQFTHCDIYLGCFQFGTTKNSAAMNILVNIFWWTSVWLKVLSCGVCLCFSLPVVSFTRHDQKFSKIVVCCCCFIPKLYHSCSHLQFQHEGSSCSTSSSTLTFAFYPF